MNNLLPEKVQVVLKGHYETEFEVLLQKIAEWSLRYIDLLEDLAYHDDLKGATVNEFPADICVFDLYLEAEVADNVIDRRVLDLWLISKEAEYELCPAPFTLSCQ